MEFRHLRYFLAVADALNFTRAAEILHIAVSPLSRAIRDLESDIGGALFIRSTRHVRLTRAGQLLVPRAEAVLSAVRALSYAAFPLREKSDLVVGLRAIPANLRHALVAAIRTACPGVEVQFRADRPTDQMRQLLRGEIDFATLTERAVDSRATVAHILDEQLALALPAIEPFISMSDISVAHIADLYFIVHPEVGPDYMHDLLAGSRGGCSVNWSIPGGATSLIASGTHTALTVTSTESPAKHYFLSDDIVVLPLRPRRVYPTYLVWLRHRAAPDDLGGIVDGIRSVFQTPFQSN